MKRLKELRESKNFTQQVLADMLHVTQQSIYKYEHGLSEPDLEILQNMAALFDTSIDYLVGATDIPFRYEAYPPDSITKDEQQILLFYRSLSGQAQDFVLELANKITPT